MTSKHPKPPCSQNCEKRTAGCHASCQEWSEYERRRNGFYKERVERKESAIRTYPANATKGFVQK